MPGLAGRLLFVTCCFKTDRLSALQLLCRTNSLILHFQSFSSLLVNSSFNRFLSSARSEMFNKICIICVLVPAFTISERMKSFKMLLIRFTISSSSHLSMVRTKASQMNTQLLGMKVLATDEILNTLSRNCRNVCTAYRLMISMDARILEECT